MLIFHSPIPRTDTSCYVSFACLDSIPCVKVIFCSLYICCISTLHQKRLLKTPRLFQVIFHGKEISSVLFTTTKVKNLCSQGHCFVSDVDIIAFIMVQLSDFRKLSVHTKTTVNVICLQFIAYLSIFEHNYVHYCVSYGMQIYRV